ncbi:MAG: hypothetical protein ABSC06_31275 [Rhodopila sp.]|jgi:hypothetical protein
MSGTPSVPISEANLRQIHADLYRVQMRWEPWKALAAIIAASAVFCGSVLGVSSYITHSPQTIVVHFDQPIPVR